MLNYEILTAQAREAGFDDAGALDVATLQFLPEVRDMCASDKCHNYGRSWSCPPAAPSLEDMRKTVEKYSEGIIVQTVAQLEDSLDFEEMMAAAARHGKNFTALWETLLAEYPGLYTMGAGGCGKCQKCTYPDEPCRFPERLSYSMEACGLVVSQVCVNNNMKYNHGNNTVAYTSCFLLA